MSYYCVTSIAELKLDIYPSILFFNEYPYENVIKDLHARCSPRRKIACKYISFKQSA